MTHQPIPATRPVALLAGVLLTLGMGPALAQSGELVPRDGRLTPEQQRRIFPDLKRLSLEDYSERTRMLERARRCVGGASDFEAYQTCRRQERQAYGQWRRQQQDQLRQLFERNGIPMPERGKGRGKNDGAG
ncbi:MAG: hypothetical protein VKN13_09810 [Cyanobacteriota bacterium]|nr:hypothetical protein [Cyanobacteriota bacterium]